MSKRLPVTSIVICTFNGAEVLPDCLKALKKQKWTGKVEIIVVNDGSTDDTAQIAKSFKANVITNKRNVGPAASRNIGIKAAKGEIIVFTDDDCRPHPTWLRELHAVYKDEKVLGVAGETRPTKKDRLLFRYLKHHNPMAPLEQTVMAPRGIAARLGGYLKGMFGRTAKQSNKVRPIYSAASANLSFRKKTLQAVNGFDESFTFSGEDQDLCRRVNQAFPGSLYVAPKAKVGHQYKPELSDTLRRSKAYGKGNVAFSRKHPDVKPVIFPFPVLIIMIAAALGILVSPWAILAALLLVPLLYSRGFRLPVPRTEALAYAGIQFLQEWYGNVGFVQGVLAPSIARNTKRQYELGAPLVAGIAVSMLVIFDFLQLWTGPLQVVYSLLFLSAVPGVLFLTVLNTKANGLRRALYAVGTSWGLLLVAVGLLGNSLVLVWPQVFSLQAPLFIGLINVVVTALAAVILVCKRTCVIALPKRLAFSSVAVISFVTALPYAGFLGAQLLNYKGTNVLAMIVLALCAVLGVGILKAQKLKSFILPYTIFVIGLTVMLLGALRGDFISGTDMSKEFYVYELTRHAGYWSPELLKDAYNACLSVNLLPTVWQEVLKIPDQYVFRMVLPLFYLITPVVVYALAKQYVTRTVAYLAALLWLAQPIFITWSLIPFRQMIAFAFFALLLLALFDARLRKLSRYVLVSFFGLGMILSHYSTSYIAVGTLALAYVLHQIVILIRVRRQNMTRSEMQPLIALPLLLILMASAYIWYGPITHSSKNIRQMVTNGIEQIERGNINIFTSDAHSQNANFFQQLSFKQPPVDAEKVWKAYVEQSEERARNRKIQTIESTSKDIRPSVLPKSDYNIAPVVADTATLSNQLLSKVLRVAIIIGLVGYVYFIVRNKRSDEHGFMIFSAAAAIIIVLVMVVPYASLSYDLGRTLLQLFTVLSLAAVAGCLWVLQLAGRYVPWFMRHSTEILAVTFAVYFLCMTGFIGQLTGGVNHKGLLNNTGRDYRAYVHAGELAGAAWLKERSGNTPVYAGYFGNNRLWVAGFDRSTNFYNEILPSAIDTRAYVYRDNGEMSSDTAIINYRGTFLVYPYPNQALEKNKNTIYSNSQVKVYK